jgi:hypothetical protein
MPVTRDRIMKKKKKNQYFWKSRGARKRKLATKLGIISCNQQY